MIPLPEIEGTWGANARRGDQLLRWRRTFEKIAPGFGAFFAITLFFCLVQSAHDGLIRRNRGFNSQRWWYPIY